MPLRVPPPTVVSTPVSPRTVSAVSANELVPARPVAPATPVFEETRYVDGGPKVGANDPLLTTIFSPGGEALKAELAALDEVIAARSADPKTYPEGENPYRIEYAVYNLNEPEVIGRLTEAAKAGVRVQVLVEQDQVKSHVYWNSLRQELVDAGFSFSVTQKGLSPEALASTQLIGMDLPGSFHLKARYFSYPHPETGALQEKLLTGSSNPTVTARENDENLHAIRDSKVIAQYRSAIEALRDGRTIENTWDAAAPVNVLFTAPGTEGPLAIDKLFELVNAEQEAIFISVFSLRDLRGPDKQKLVNQLAAAKARGVHVTVVTDRKQSDGVDASGAPAKGATDDRTDELLQKAGIPTYEALNNGPGDYHAMHHKAAIFGLSAPKIVTDAGNWTYSSLGNSGSGYTRNAESVLFIDSKALDGGETGRRYLSEFLRVLRQYAPQNPEQPDAEALIASMQAHPSWPTVKVSFDVLARTHFGQDVYVRGGAEALGGWDGEGIKLDTEAGTYPYWRTDALELPLGMKLEYKVVKRDGGKVDWEPGENAIVILDPSDDEGADEKRIVDAFGNHG